MPQFNPSARKAEGPARRCRRIAALLFVVASLSTGCVERRFTVRTNPPGAQLYVDDYEIGTTPVSTNFTYYGTRQIRLVKDGYETLVIKQPVPAPWYEWFPFDFVTENLVPGHIRDERVVTYNMQPAVQVPNEQLVSRAEALRQNGKAGALAASAARGPQPIGAVSPAPNTLPGPAVRPGVETLPPGAVAPPVNALPPPVTLPPPGAQLPPPGYSAPPAYATPPVAAPDAGGRPLEPLP